MLMMMMFLGLVTLKVNMSASFVTKGVNRTKIIIPNSVPINDAERASMFAFLVSPRSANGCPSKQVAAAEPVPGMLMRIAETEPPNMAPIYTPKRIVSAESNWSE